MKDDGATKPTMFKTYSPKPLTYTNNAKQEDLAFRQAPSYNNPDRRNTWEIPNNPLFVINPLNGKYVEPNWSKKASQSKLKTFWSHPEYQFKNGDKSICAPPLPPPSKYPVMKIGVPANTSGFMASYF
jgi:hypothetical protein